MALRNGRFEKLYAVSPQLPHVICCISWGHRSLSMSLAILLLDLIGLLKACRSQLAFCCSLIT